MMHITDSFPETRWNYSEPEHMGLVLLIPHVMRKCNQHMVCITEFIQIKDTETQNGIIELFEMKGALKTI